MSIIDGITNSIVGTVAVNEPYEMAINPNTDKVYVTYYESGILSIISESLNEQNSSIQLDSIIITSIILVAAGIFAAILLRRKQIQKSQ